MTNGRGAREIIVEYKGNDRQTRMRERERDWRRERERENVRERGGRIEIERKGDRF